MWQDRREQESTSGWQPPLARRRAVPLRRMWRDQTGTTAIEFAFIALGLIYLMCGIIELDISSLASAWAAARCWAMC